MKIPIVKINPLPCPFCNNIPIVVKDPLFHGSHGYSGCYEYYVKCENPKCRINPKTKSYNTVYGKSEEECIDKSIKDWNIRGDKDGN